MDAYPSNPSSNNKTNETPNPFQSNLAQPNTHQAPEITLPKGGGALKGIDEKLAVNPVTGTGGTSLPLPVAPARGGFTPALSIGYSSGSGNGTFGLGWGMSNPSIIRKTNQTLPRYEDGTESDTFIMAGAEDLVPKLDNSTGAWRPVERAQGNHRVREYRPRIEGSWIRIEQWTHQTTGIIHWRTISTTNTITVYGDTPSSRIAHPQDPLKIFEWKISYSYDNLGNVIVYEYQLEDLVGVVPTVYEKNRTLQTIANTYLKRVHYGNRTPYHHGDAPLPVNDFLFETVLDYGDHSAGHFGRLPDQPWAARHDAFSNYRAGFEIRTYRLCQRVLLFHKFDLVDQPVPHLLVRALELTYEDFPEMQASTYPLEGFTYLKAAQVRGYQYNTTTQQYEDSDQPKIEFAYQGHAWDTTIHELDNYDHLPTGINQNGYQWLDFYGEGLSGILTEQGKAWYYKANLGGGQFAPPELLTEKPSFSGVGQPLQFQDLEGDGSRQLVQYTTSPKGFFDRINNDQWTGFRYFEQLPNRNLQSDPYARWIDLDGDGRADLLITVDELFEWYPSKGKEGFGAANRVYMALDDEEGPRLVFADQEQSIFLADMTGDGLTDIVRIQNGAICYWANMGYGQFSAKVTMQHAPIFGHNEQFNPNYLYLLDIDGSGTTDVAYYHKNTLQVWCNWSGNEWVQAPKIINPFPVMDPNTRLDVVDLLGTGTSCLVWSSSHAKDQQTPLKYLHLTAGRKPHLLYHYKNNLGASTELRYCPSTKFYLEDRAAGRPWATKLPFPVHVVEQVTVTDHIQQTIFTQQYSYHHGYYDRIEREFRGFGRVETLDTTSLNELLATGANNVQIDHYQVPIKTVSWYHTGAALDEQSLIEAYEAEYYQNPTIERRLSALTLPQGLSDRAYLEAHRALKGAPLRQEVYSLDTGNPDHIHPYNTSRQSYRLQLVQPHEGQRYASFVLVPEQQISFAYERNPIDPRISQELVLATDAMGIPTQTASVIYPRLQTLTDPKLWMVQAEQAKLHVVVREITLTDDVNLPNAYRLRMAYEEQVYEILQATWSGGSYFEPQGLKTMVDQATVLDYSQEPTQTGTIYKRLHGRTLAQLLKDDLSGAAPINELTTLAIPYKTYQLTYTPSQLNALFTTGNGTDLLHDLFQSNPEGWTDLSDLGYVDVLSDGNWWLHSGTTIYDPATALNDFYLPQGVQDILGNATTIQYDGYRLLPIRVEDALGNTSQADYDYRLLQPWRMTDPNGNQSEVAFDALGIVVKSAILGKIDPVTGQTEGDTLAHPTAQLSYDFYNYQLNGQPNYIHTQIREEHHSQNPVATWQESYAYSSGMGEVILTKVQTKDGDALQWQNGVLNTVDTSTLPTKRWIGNGRTILNNKGMPIQQFEPYFSVNHEFESAPELVEIGYSPILYYDATGRNNRTELPNGTLTRVEFDAWQATSYDVNDTVLESAWRTERLPSTTASPEEKRALQVTLDHANTPTTTHLDALGRTVYAEAIGSTGTTTTALYTQTDLAGRFARIYDQLATEELQQNTVGHYTTNRGISSESWTNLLGQVIHDWTAVKGDGYTLSDALGRVVRIWDNPDHTQSQTFRTIYDTLHRPLATYVQQGGNVEICLAQTEYGESQPNAQVANLRGQAYQSRDQSGVLTTVAFDFKGNPLQVTRQLTQVYDQTIDWNQSVPLEQATPQSATFQTSSSYDALNRPTLTVLPDGSRVRPSYNTGGYLERLEVQVLGQGAWQLFLNGQDFDAKGQQQWKRYGNGSLTRYFYDAKSFRLRNLLTTQGSEKLQDLRYTYDPAGNVTTVKDEAQSTYYYNNQAVSPLKEYVYDDLYRLVSATGRQHASAGAPRAQQTPSYAAPLPHTSIQNAVSTYRQTYQYDKVNNLIQVHQINAWTRNYTYGLDATNRLLSTQISGLSTVNYQYDDWGNMIGMPHLQALHWNYQDELVQVELDLNGNVAHYNYDGSKQRVRKVITQNGIKQQERLYLVGVERYREYNNNGTVTLERWTLQVEDIAQVDTLTIDNATIVNTPQPVIRYQYRDHLGSSTVECNEQGQVISYEEYYPYGATAYQVSSSSADVSLKRYRFTNKERDNETGLDYFGVRYYASWLGRWISADPGGFVDGLNLYVYVRGNPVNGVDELGYSTDSIHLDANGNVIAEYDDGDDNTYQHDDLDINNGQHLDGIRSKLDQRIGLSGTSGGGELVPPPPNLSVTYTITVQHEIVYPSKGTLWEYVPFMNYPEMRMTGLVIDGVEIEESEEDSYKIIWRVPQTSAFNGGKLMRYNTFIWEGEEHEFGEALENFDPTDKAYKRDIGIATAFYEGFVFGLNEGSAGLSGAVVAARGYKAARASVMKKWSNVGAGFTHKGSGVYKGYKPHEISGAIDFEVSHATVLGPSSIGDFVATTGIFKGKTFDHLGVPAEAFGKAKSPTTFMNKFLKSVDGHFGKFSKGVDRLIIDLKNFSPQQIQKIKSHINQKHGHLVHRAHFLNDVPNNKF